VQHGASLEGGKSNARETLACYSDPGFLILSIVHCVLSHSREINDIDAALVPPRRERSVEMRVDEELMGGQ
jgi:hypothetical protein